MSASFAFFHINSMPMETDVGCRAFGEYQKEFDGTPARSFASLVATDVYGRYDKLSVKHEVRKHTRGRLYDGSVFEEFYEENDFDAYFCRKSSLITFATSKVVARNFVNHANSSFADVFNADYLKINFPVVQARSPEIRGIWVGSMAQPFIESAGFFGANVDQSDIYKLAQSFGIASSMLVLYPFRGENVQLILSADYTITFPGRIDGKMCLDVIHQMQSDLLCDAVKVEKSPHNKSKDRQLKRVKRA